MAILIDSALWPAHGTHWCHVISDTSLDELHAFARRCALPERSFDRDHYDAPLERRDELIRAGAVPVDGRTLVRALERSGLRVSARERRRGR